MVAVDGHVGRAGVDGGQLDLLGVVAVAGDHDDPVWLKHPAHRPGLAQVAAVARKRVAHLGDRAIAVVGQGLDQDRGAAGAVALVDDLLQVAAFAAAHTARDSTLDVLGGHVAFARLLDGQAQAEVGIGVTAARTCGHRDLLAQLGKELAATGVVHALLAADLAPFRMSGHILSSRPPARSGGPTLLPSDDILS